MLKIEENEKTAGMSRNRKTWNRKMSKWFKRGCQRRFRLDVKHNKEVYSKMNNEKRVWRE